MDSLFYVYIPKLYFNPLQKLSHQYTVKDEGTQNEKINGQNNCLNWFEPKLLKIYITFMSLEQTMETTRPGEKARETIQARNSNGICGLRERSDMFL